MKSVARFGSCNVVDEELLEDASRVVKGNIAPVDTTPSYRELLSSWGHRKWSSRQIDFSVDAEQWRDPRLFNDTQRKTIEWIAMRFCLGEKHVVPQLLSVANAALGSDARACLATQIADKARHCAIFDRFLYEVCGVTNAGLRKSFDINGHVAGEKQGDPLDTLLADVANRLRHDPTDRMALYEAVVLSMVVIDGTLALTGAHFITRSLTCLGVLPGTRTGLLRIAGDKARHVVFGVRLLADAIDKDAATATVVTETLDRAIPLATLVLVPPWANDPFDYRDPTTGIHSSEVLTFAAASLRKQLGAIGLKPGSGNARRDVASAA